MRIFRHYLRKGEKRMGKTITMKTIDALNLLYWVESEESLNDQKSDTES